MKRLVYCKRILVAAALILSAVQLSPAEQKTQPKSPWDMTELSKAPKVYAATKPESQHANIRGLFYESEPYQGKPTRVFAWYGAPADASPDRKVPGVVLVHGGGGTAFPGWVALWNKRGYAAISMDLEGHMSPSARGKRPGHEWSGPQRAGIFGDITKPEKDQWMYHAVAAVIRAHSLLRSMPEVDPERTGLTGISWGGIVVCNVVGVDRRFKFAIPVYGCGFLFEAGNMYQQAFEGMSKSDMEKCKRLWDGAGHLPNASMPMLWVSGTNDWHFPPNILQRSYRATAGQRTLCIRVGMRHSHTNGWAPEEIYAFADSIVKKGPPLIKITGQGRQDAQAWAQADPTTPVAEAKLCFSTDSGTWSARKWQMQPAQIDPKTNTVTAEVPKDATVYYFTLTDKRKLLVSSEHVETARPQQRPDTQPTHN